MRYRNGKELFMEIVIKSNNGFTSVALNGVDISDGLRRIEFKHDAGMSLPEIKLSFYSVDCAERK